MFRSFKPWKCVRQSTSRGFTLVEVIITIALVAVLAGIAAPSIGSMVKRSQSKSLAREIASHLRVARNQASSRGEVVIVRPSTANRGEFTTHRTANNASSCRQITAADIVAAPIVSFNALTIAEPYHVEELEPPVGEICFQPDGRVLQVGGTPLPNGALCQGEAFIAWTAGDTLPPDGVGCGARTIDEADASYYWRISVWENGQITVSNK